MQLTIESLAYGGAGVAHADDGVTVFLDGVCPGDVVKAETTEDHGRFRKASVTDVLEPSVSRVSPRCPYFGTCGGCQWQHIDYGIQLEWKRRAVVDSLTRIGGLDVPVAETLGSSHAYGYRNKVELSVGNDSGRLALGYMEAGSDRVLPVERCPLLPRHAERAPRALAGALRYLSSRVDAPVRRVAFRVSTSGHAEVDIWTAPGSFPRQLAAKVLADAVGAKTVTRVLAKGDLKNRDVTKVEVLAGPGAWEERLGSHRYLVSAPSFFQVNSAAATRLRQVVIDALSPDGTDTVLDLYSGVGTFTVPLAELAGEVIAVESSRYAIADLRRNLEINGVDARVEPGDAEHALPSLGRADLVVVDPPRAGLTSGVIESLVQTRARRVAYVSCDPATMARDVRRFAEHGYEPAMATPVDLFPQTYHVETVVVLNAI